MVYSEEVVAVVVSYSQDVYGISIGKSGCGSSGVVFVVPCPV